MLHHCFVVNFLEFVWITLVEKCSVKCKFIGLILGYYSWVIIINIIWVPRYFLLCIFLCRRNSVFICLEMECDPPATWDHLLTRHAVTITYVAPTELIWNFKWLCLACNFWRDSFSYIRFSPPFFLSSPFSPLSSSLLSHGQPSVLCVQAYKQNFCCTDSWCTSTDNVYCFLLIYEVLYVRPRHTGT